MSEVRYSGATPTFERVAVSFKEEDSERGMPIGPVIIVDLDARDADENVDDGPGVPLGYRPPWMVERGWLTKDAALAIAGEYAVELGES